MNDGVSVIIPTYNASRYVTEAVDSVLNQDYDNCEIIVVDDGSTDDTREALRKYEGKIRYIYQENGGPAKARNTGIISSQGDYIAFLDADDLWLPGKLRKQIDFLHRHSQYAMVYTDMKHVVEGKIVHESYLKERNYRYVSSGFIYENLLRECFIFTPTVIVERECLEKVGLFREDLRISEDYDLWLRIADEYEIGFLDEPLVIRNRHESNLTGDRYLYITSCIQLFEELLEKNKENRKRVKIIKEALAVRYFNLGYYLFELGRLRESRYNFVKSLRYRYSNRSMIRALASFLPKLWIDYIRRIRGMAG